MRREFIEQLLTYEIWFTPAVSKPGHRNYHQSCFKVKIPGIPPQRCSFRWTGERHRWVWFVFFFITRSLGDSSRARLAPVRWQVFQNHWFIQPKCMAGACWCVSIKGDMVIKYILFSALKQMHLWLLLSHVKQLTLLVLHSTLQIRVTTLCCQWVSVRCYEMSFSMI